MIKVLFIPEEEESAVYQDIADILDMSSKTNVVPKKLTNTLMVVLFLLY